MSDMIEIGTAKANTGTIAEGSFRYDYFYDFYDLAYSETGFSDFYSDFI